MDQKKGKNASYFVSNPVPGTYNRHIFVYKKVNFILTANKTKFRGTSYLKFILQCLLTFPVPSLPYSAYLTFPVPSLPCSVRN